MQHLDRLLLDPATRADLWRTITAEIERYIGDRDQLPIAPEVSPDTIRADLADLTFAQPLEPRAAIAVTLRGLREQQMHTGHRRSFGLFNPTPATMGIAADALVAAFNPQLAAWGHSPFAVEVEQHLIRAFADRFDYNAKETDGTFTSGGNEANHTALICALTSTFAQFSRSGLRGLERQPVLYASSESHHSLVKATRACGLGTDALRLIATDDRLGMDVAALHEAIVRDRAAGLAPFMVVATAGTTSAGCIDPLAAIADLAAQHGLWLHVDAAWGGAAALVPELRPLLHGIERADSITFDAHKWLAVPMGGGLFLTRHRDVLGQAFRVTPSYIPPNVDGLEVVDPYTHSLQWSRRFIGLKLFLTLLVAGWDGYAAMIRQQIALGDQLRAALADTQWRVLNDTPLPVVCFADGWRPHGSRSHLDAILRETTATGEVWLSVTQLAGYMPALRACVTSYRTTADDVIALVEMLNRARGSCRTH